MRPLGSEAGAQLAIDANALGNLRNQAKTAPREAIGKAAQQFEALFVQMLMKQMREALPQDGPLSSDAEKSYTAMFDQQLAQQLSSRGIGLRKVIEQQLARQIGTAASSSDADPASPKSVRTETSLQKASFALPVRPSATAQGATAVMDQAPGLIPAGVAAFIDKLRPHAEAVAQAAGIPVHYLLAQAGLETGWGKSLPRTADGQTSHNLFGIKAGTQWKGATAEAPTTEVVQGQAVRTTERFRAYGSFTEAFQDFATLLKDSARYAGVIAKSADPRAYAEGLQRAGYATDPHYGAKLARSIELVARKLGVPVTSPPVQVGATPADKARTAS
ncbi:MAG: flagellar assembly peptidoglycan hydrolase FlgJ [Pseudomonadota bacterium]|nr:flagellar assembly peptidoglycan hydrolase FlgJ [Pseudomonadota bacterium]